MHEQYQPDFGRVEEWTRDERRLLTPFATNIDGLVTVLHNLPPELVGALCSRASRANGSLLRVLLREYLQPIIDGDDELTEELVETVRFLSVHGFKKILNNQRAQQFYAKWLSQYGDDSIAQITGTHVVLWGISQVAMKFVEDQRIGLEPIEKSTRYVNFGEKVNGRYLYYVPRPDLERLDLLEKYTTTLDHLFDTYVALLPPLKEWLKKNYDEKESVLEKKAFDALRGLLPMATVGQVAFRGNAQAFEYLINRTAQHPLGECRWLAESLKAELDQEIPSLLLRTTGDKAMDYQTYLNKRYSTVREALRHIGSPGTYVFFARAPVVSLVEYDEDAEEKILTGIIFQQKHCIWQQAREQVRLLFSSEKKEIIRAYLCNRTERWQKVGRAFENSYLRFEIVMDIGAYRDLHRHRMMTQERQRFSTHHGYDIPPEVESAGLSESYCQALNLAHLLFLKLEAEDVELAQYAVPLAYRIRFYEWQNFRQLFWETELRTISQGHPNYRFIEQQKYRLIKEKFPLLAEYMLVDMNQYEVSRRGTEEKATEKEKKILENLT